MYDLDYSSFLSISLPRISRIRGSIVPIRLAVQTSTSTTAAVSSTSRFGQESRNLLSGVRQHLHERLTHANVAAVIVERRGATGVSHTTRATDSMHVLIDLRRHVVVDHLQLTSINQS